MTSLWLDRPSKPVQDPLNPEQPVDDLVVGAGLTGLATALMLARAGRDVLVVEARSIGAVTTGNTTGKVSLLPGTKLGSMRHSQSDRVCRAYLDACEEGQQWLLRFCADHGVDVDRRDAITYAASPDELGTARRELEASQALGLDTHWVDTMDVPFPFHGGVVLPDQAQIDPMPVLDALVDQIHEHGGRVHEGRRVVGASLTGPRRATLDDGTELTAKEIVLATGIPVLDRGLFFAKVEPKRSYALAFTGAAAPDGMFLSAGSSSTRSIRDAAGPDGSRRLLIGGEGHTVGRTRSERGHVDRLRAWTAEHFPGATETHAWSAQDYSPHDGLPQMGKLPRGGGHIYMATGYDKWGMAAGIAAARTISGQILGSKPSWATTIGRRITRPAGAAKIAQINAGVGVAQVAQVAEGLRDHTFPKATGESCTVTTVCTHLGGALDWNDAEKSWDCPLHGSRFTADGDVLEGPATKPLRRRKD